MEKFDLYETGTKSAIDEFEHKSVIDLSPYGKETDNKKTKE